MTFSTIYSLDTDERAPIAGRLPDRGMPENWISISFGALAWTSPLAAIAVRIPFGTVLVSTWNQPFQRLVHPGTPQDEVINGTAQDDVLYGLGGDDTIYGHDGDDFLNGGSGTNVIYGGLGNDTVSYAEATGNILLDLTSSVDIASNNALAGWDPQSGTYIYSADKLFEIENVEGSEFSDSIWGDSQSNIILGLNGDDSLYGEGGDDILYGGAGNDSIYGGDGDDTIFGGAGNSGNWYHDLQGEAGDDILIVQGVAGGDSYDGGTGIDTIEFENTTIGMLVDLQNRWVTTIGIDPEFQNSSIGQVENIKGTDHGDLLTGDDQDNKFWGNGGNDELDGGAGSDTAAFAGRLSDYLITRLSGTSMQITDNRSQAQIDADAGGTGVSDGTDTADNFEFFEFLDRTYSFAELEAIANWVPTGAVTVNGTAEQGQTLSMSSTLADANGLGTFSYQWLRDGVDISGATAQTYTLEQADVGARMSVRVSYTDGDGYAETVTSAATASVANVNDAPGGIVRVNGEATQGETLSVTYALVDVDGIGTVSFQWLRDGKAISGATGGTYSLEQADVDTAMSVRVSYVDGYGTAESVTSSETGPVINVNDKPIGAVLISGEAYVGTKIKADISNLSDPDGPNQLPVAYQWLRGGVAITGAQEKTYKITKEDIGAKIKVQITYTDAFGTVEFVTSAATERVDYEDLNEIGTDATETWIGGGGDDIFKGKKGDDTISGKGGADELYGGQGVDLIKGGAGNDIVYGGNGDDSIEGNDGNDLLFGENGRDGLKGGKGSDEIHGGDDSDTLEGGDGSDMLFGDDGNGTLLGGKGADSLFGSSGDDDLSGGDKGDILDGGDGDDVLKGGAGSDELLGGAGADNLTGNEGGDTLKGGSGKDRLTGGDGSDVLKGGKGKDRLEAGKGDDTLSGGNGNDRLHGDSGTDILDGGAGDDILNGGKSPDTFIYAKGNDVIEDFDAREDVIEIASGLGGVTSESDVLALANEIGGDVVIDFGSGNSLTVANLSDPDLLVGAIHIL